MKRIFLIYIIIGVVLAACQNDDSFSTDRGLRLTFSVDTLKMDTVFAHNASSTYSFWVHNDNDEGLRLSSVRLSRRNQTGFRVNVDGIYLDNSNGSQTTDVEIRRRDSVMVFVELTAPETHQQEPVVVEDNLVFTLESGTEQQVLLRAWAWDVERLTDLVVADDVTIESDVPLLVMGSIKIEEGATLTIRNSSLFFHDQAGIDVYGRLEAEGCTLRGDRLDRMFSYLPYDRVSGQWGGLHFYSSSTGNILRNTEIRNATEAVKCDSAAVDSIQARLTMDHCIVHNAKGCGVEAVNAHVVMEYCQLTNTLGHCVSLTGGIARISHCTIAQFYPFSADRGAVLYLSNAGENVSLPLSLWCDSSILTGYDDDVLVGVMYGDDEASLDYHFSNSLLRSPKVETADSVRYEAILWESPKDSIQGTKHFKTIDTDNLLYDFHLDSLSTAKGLGCY